MSRVNRQPFRLMRSVAAGVIHNPYAGRYVEDLSELIAEGNHWGQAGADGRRGVGRDRAHSLGLQGCAVVRSHYVTVEVHIPDAPLPNELVVIAAVVNRGRLNTRCGGFTAKQPVKRTG